MLCWPSSRPRDRPAVAAGAHRARGAGPQSLGVGRERDDGQRSISGVHHRHRIGIRHGALRRTQLGCLYPGGGDQIGPDGVRVVGAHLDKHRPHIIGKVTHPDRRQT